MRCACLVLAILFLLGACTPGPLTLAVPSPASPFSTPVPTATATDTPSATPPPILTIVPPPQPPTDTPTLVVQVSDTPLSDPTPTLACDHDTASLVLSTNAENLKIGDSIQVTVTLNNTGCVALGMPQYRLSIDSGGSQASFTPAAPEPLVHYLAVNPGQTDSAEFTLTAAASGQAKLTATVSYEVHIGYPGPAYWGGVSSEPLVITVTP
jgi:hypothetical protein